MSLARTWDNERQLRPTNLYAPSDGQLAFHTSTHPIRLLCPGNGWGKSAAMGHEIEAWMNHSNRWQETPKHRILAVWFCPQYKQFEFMRAMLAEKCWGPIPKWHVSDHYFEWPDGGRLYVASHDRDWSYLQGIALDLALFDEHFPERLWTEMLLRRRGKRRTRFVVAATMTKGMTWEFKHIYKPWLDFHTALGLNEKMAIEQQRNPNIFAWPYGGILDNPSMGATDKKWYEESLVTVSDKERMVRLGGGFQDWSGDAVFDIDALNRMKVRMIELERLYPTAIRNGTFLLKEAA